MNDNHKGGAKILSFGIPQEIVEPTGNFHEIDFWRCNCGSNDFNFSVQNGLICLNCATVQRGYDAGRKTDPG